MKILSTIFGFSLCFIQVLSMTSCGIDNSGIDMVYEGEASIETYPWLGILYYPFNNKRFTTGVVLVTRQIALAAATEIERLPKDDFRAKARVVIGVNCSGPHISIRDYSYHPDYTFKTFSALTLIQLETDLLQVDLRPICPPPSYFKDPQFYAMVLSNDCRKSRITIHKMKYVSPKACKEYYRRSNLDIESIWPTHTACAKSLSGGKCIWRSGAILVIKSEKRWRLLGFGVYGPGCQAPSRFLDYGMYHRWVERSIRKIGEPTITTISDNKVVFRRMSGNIQRFGTCDKEETIRELYSDTDVIDVTTSGLGHFSYNVSLYANVEYSCIIFSTDYKGKSSLKHKPKLKIQRWCAGSPGLCYGFGLLSIHFSISVDFKQHFSFELRAYGQEARIVDPLRALEYVNENMRRLKILRIKELRERIKASSFRKYVYLA